MLSPIPYEGMVFPPRRSTPAEGRLPSFPRSMLLLWQEVLRAAPPGREISLRACAHGARRCFANSQWRRNRIRGNKGSGHERGSSLANAHQRQHYFRRGEGSGREREDTERGAQALSPVQDLRLERRRKSTRRESILRVGLARRDSSAMVPSLPPPSMITSFKKAQKMRR